MCMLSPTHSSTAQVTKPFGRTVKLLRKVKNLRSGSSMTRWLVSFGHGLGSGAFDRRELPDMEMEEDCFRKLVSSEVFAPVSAMKRSTSDDQKTAAHNGKSSLGKAPADETSTHQQDARVEAEAGQPEPRAETAPPQPPPHNFQMNDSSSLSEDAVNDNDNGVRHKRKVSNGSLSPSASDDQQPPTKKLCPAPLVKSEEPPTDEPDAMDEERMDASTSGRDEEPQTQPPAQELPPAPPVKEEEAEVQTETKVEEAGIEVEKETKVKEETVVMVEPKVGEAVEAKVKMDTERTPDLKSVHSDVAKDEAEDSGEEKEQKQPPPSPPPSMEDVSSTPPPPPQVEDISQINVAMEEVKAPPIEEDAPEPQPEPEIVIANEAEENKGTCSTNLLHQSSSGELSSSSNKKTEEEVEPINEAVKALSLPPPPKAPTPPPMLMAHDLLAKAKLAKKLSQKPISLQKLKQQARAKAIEKAMQQGKGGKKQKRKGERKSRRYQKNAPSPQKPQPSEAASTNSSEEAEENVEKIVMNTGTLYLYRGENPRAEFIRRK